jgi:uncharacterized ion transporter superfamily protein YfcC
MAVLAAAGVRYDEWLGFAGPRYLGLVALGMVAITIAVGIGFG